MTKDVLIRISGLQAIDGETNDVEMIFTGDYYLKNGKHYVIYEEIMEGFDGKVHNTVKIGPNLVDIKKKGVIGAHMVFELDKKSQTRYSTPMGELIVEIGTNRIRIEEEEHHLLVLIGYSLDINYQHVSDNQIVMDICSREKAKLSL